MTCGLAYFLKTSLQSEIKSHLRSVVILFSSQLNGFFAGDHRGVVTPVPIPNTEVKGPIAEGSAGLARARVGRRRQFFFKKLLGDYVALGLAYARRVRFPMGREPPQGADTLLGHPLRSGDMAFFIAIRIFFPPCSIGKIWYNHPQ